MTTITQVTDGIKESTGIDPTSLLAGFLGGKVATSNTGKTNVTCTCHECENSEDESFAVVSTPATKIPEVAPFDQESLNKILKDGSKNKKQK